MRGGRWQRVIGHPLDLSHREAEHSVGNSGASTCSDAFCNHGGGRPYMVRRPAGLGRGYVGRPVMRALGAA